MSSTKNEEPLQAGFELTPTAPLDDGVARLLVGRRLDRCSATIAGASSPGRLPAHLGPANAARGRSGRASCLLTRRCSASANGRAISCCAPCPGRASAAAPARISCAQDEDQRSRLTAALAGNTGDPAGGRRPSCFARKEQCGVSAGARPLGKRRAASRCSSVSNRRLYRAHNSNPAIAGGHGRAVEPPSTTVPNNRAPAGNRGDRGTPE